MAIFFTANTAGATPLLGEPREEYPHGSGVGLSLTELGATNTSGSDGVSFNSEMNSIAASVTESYEQLLPSSFDLVHRNRISPRLSGLSPMSYRFVLLLLAAHVVLVVMEPSNMLVLTFIWYLPLALLLTYAQKYRQHAHMDTIVKFFAAGFIPAAIFIFVIEVILTAFVSVACFWNQRNDIRASLKQEPHVLRLHRNVGYFVFFFLLAYFVAALVEERVKLASLSSRHLTCCFWVPHHRRTLGGCNPYAILMYLLAASAGYATVESLVYLYFPTILVRLTATSAAAAPISFSARLGQAALRACLSTPLHLCCAGFTAVGVIKRLKLHSNGRIFSKWQGMKLILPAVVLHGTFDLWSFALTAYVPHGRFSPRILDFAHTTGSALLVFVGYVILAWQIHQLDLHAITNRARMNNAAKDGGGLIWFAPQV